VTATDLTPRIEGAIELADGRRLGYAEYGAPTGRPIFWFHGTPGARRQVPPALRRIAGARDFRIVALERPGVGASSRHAYANLRGWAHDVGEIADGFGFERFACVGLSGGGPYVLACAHEHPDRMTAGIVLGGVAPAIGPERARGGIVGQLARVAPFIQLFREPIARTAWVLMRAAEPLKSPAFDLYVRFSPPGDRELFAKPGMKEMFLDDLTRGYRTHLHAPVFDAVLFTREWGFSLTNIRVPISFWHGDRDHIVLLAHARHLVSLVPGASLRVRSGESHLGALDAAEEILDTIAGLWDLRAGEVPGRAVGTADLGSAGA
jgi:pimeloyl-ACP methyl ester carboxylesterase